MIYKINFIDGPRLVETLQPKIIMSVDRNLALRCQADTEDFLDIAYIWTHNGMRIRDTDIINNNRMVIYNFFLNSSILYFNIIYRDSKEDI